MGTDEYVNWSWFRHVGEAIEKAHSEGFQVIALDTVEGAKNILVEPPLGKVAFVCGNERHGLDAPTLKKCDGIYALPVYGRKNSLNVGTAYAVAAYSCLDGLHLQK